MIKVSTPGAQTRYNQLKVIILCLAASKLMPNIMLIRIKIDLITVFSDNRARFRENDCTF